MTRSGKRQQHTRPRRVNGLSRPYTKAQIAGWVALFASIVQFAFIITPLLPWKVSIPVTALFLIVVGFVLYYGTLTVVINPVDIYLYQHLKQQDDEDEQIQLPTNTAPAVSNDDGEINNGNDNNNSSNGQQQQQQNQRKVTTCLCIPSSTSAKKKNKYFDRSDPRRYISDVPPDGGEDMKQCWICDTQVATHSMHCKFCNKCVYHFDHHCLWLNTCIGAANYKQFFKTMVSLFYMELIHFIVQAVVLIDLYVRFGSTSYRANDNWFGYNIQSKIPIAEIFTGIIVFFIIFNIVSMILLGQLIHFHLGLQKQQLTTYEFIVLDSKKRREQGKLLGDLERNRKVEIDKARAAKRKCRVWHLKLGRFCRTTMNWTCCDPLEIPTPYEPDPEAGFANALGGTTTTISSNKPPNTTTPTTSAPSSYTTKEIEDESRTTTTSPTSTTIPTPTLTNGHNSSSIDFDETPMSKSLQQETIGAIKNTVTDLNCNESTPDNYNNSASSNNIEHPSLERPTTPDFYFR